MKERQLTEKELEKVFWSSSGQYEILKQFRKKFGDSIYTGRGSSFGRPWTNTTILCKEKKEYWVGVFWRVDWRKNEDKYVPYICLRYYKTKEERSEDDDKYFYGMREIFDDLAQEFPRLKFAKTHNSGKKEREIGILFFDNEKNQIPLCIDELALFSKEFLSKVKDKSLFYEN